MWANKWPSHPDSVPVGVTRRVETGASVGEIQRWAQLDAVELNDWMLRRVPMLKMPMIHARKVSAMLGNSSEGEVQSKIGR